MTFLTKRAIFHPLKQKGCVWMDDPGDFYFCRDAPNVRPKIGKNPLSVFGRISEKTE